MRELIFFLCGTFLGSVITMFTIAMVLANKDKENDK